MIPYFVLFDDDEKLSILSIHMMLGLGPDDRMIAGHRFKVLCA